MKRRFLVAALLLVPSLAPARELGIGLGVDLPPITVVENAAVDYEQRLVSLDVPLFVGRWRVAPAVGYGSGVPDSRAEFDDDEVTRLSFGVGVARAFAVAEDLRGWVGARAGLVRREVADTSALDWFGGAVAGGEYFLGPSLSLGSDLRLTYTSLEAGRVEYTYRIPLDPPPTVPDFGVPVRGWSLAADFAVSLRYYLW